MKHENALREILTDEALSAMLRMEIEMTQVAVQGKRALTPVFHGIGIAGNDMGFFAAPIDAAGRLTRDLAFELGRTITMRQCTPMAVFLTSEAWLSEWPQDHDAPLVLPEDDPNRKEAVIIAMLCADRRHALINLPIVRDADGNITLPDAETTEPTVEAPESQLSQHHLLEAFFYGVASTTIGKLARRN